MNSKVIKSKVNTVVTSIPKGFRPNECGQVDRAAMSGGEKENLILKI